MTASTAINDGVQTGVAGDLSGAAVQCRFGDQLEAAGATPGRARRVHESGGADARHPAAPRHGPARRVRHVVRPNTNLLFHFQNIEKGRARSPGSRRSDSPRRTSWPDRWITGRPTSVPRIEWSNPRGVVKVGWDGSWFQNDVSTLVWDNPIRATDYTYWSAYSPGDGTSQGRTDLWPDTSMNMISGTATYKLPARTRAYANFGFSKYGNDDTLLPHTINSAIPVIPLERESADVSADVTSAAAGVCRSSQPTGSGSTSGTSCTTGTTRTPTKGDGERLDDVPGHGVRAVRPGHRAVPRRRRCGAVLVSRGSYFDSDMSYSVLPFTALRLGYSRETDKRTFREFESTADNIVRVAMDTTGWSYLQLRARSRLRETHGIRPGRGSVRRGERGHRAAAPIRHLGPQPPPLHLPGHGRARRQVLGQRAGRASFARSGPTPSSASSTPTATSTPWAWTSPRLRRSRSG